MNISTSLLNVAEKKLIIEEIDYLSSLISGSYGATATGQSIVNNGQIEINKDGYNFINAIYSPTNARAVLVRDYCLHVAKAVNELVGDGTTVAMILSLEIAKKILSSDLQNHEIMQLLKEFPQEFSKLLKKHSKKATSKKILFNLAKNACRDAGLSKLVVEAVMLQNKRKSGEIIIADSQGLPSFVQEYDGVMLTLIGSGISAFTVKTLTNDGAMAGNVGSLKAPNVFLTKDITTSVELKGLVQVLLSYHIAKGNLESEEIRPYLLGFDMSKTGGITEATVSQELLNINTKGFELDGKTYTNIKIIPFQGGDYSSNSDVGLENEAIRVKLGVPVEGYIIGTRGVGRSTCPESVSRLYSLSEQNPELLVQKLDAMAGSGESLGVRTTDLFIHNPAINLTEMNALRVQIRDKFNSAVDLARRQSDNGMVNTHSVTAILEDVRRSLDLKKIYLNINVSTLVDARYTKSLVEDALESCLTAIDSDLGSIRGGGLGLYKIAQELSPRYKMFAEWLSKPLELQVAKTSLSLEEVRQSEAPFDYLTKKQDESILDNAETFRVLVTEAIGLSKIFLGASITYIQE